MTDTDLPQARIDELRAEVRARVDAYKPGDYAKKRKSKYNNSRSELDGYTFDSRAEMRRYTQLKLLQFNGQIDKLEVHPRFEVIPAMKINGKRERAIFYEADFAYYEEGRWVVEDVKGYVTDVFRLKRRLFVLRHPEALFKIIQAV